jgi:hypothetical protein
MPHASGFDLDDSLWPLLIVRFVGAPTLDDLDKYLARRLTYLQRYEQHVIIYDAREARMFSNALIQRHVAWSKQHEALRRGSVVASAVVVTSPLIRMAASTLLHFLPSKTPSRFCASVPEAVNWLADWLQKEGYPVQANQARQRFGTGPGWRGGT